MKAGSRSIGCCNRSFRRQTQRTLPHRTVQRHCQLGWYWGRDCSQVKPLSDTLLNGDLAYVAPIRTRLRQCANDLRPQWLDILRNDQESNTVRFRAALGLAGLDGEQSQTEWADADLQFIASELTSSFAKPN
jgi:hypothetical protein